jgi:hypothetical protein
MLAFLVALTVAAAQPCPAPALAALKEAAARVQAFDVAGAVARLRAPTVGICEETEVAGVYIGGLFAAMEAYKQGGSAESLAPVQDAIAALERISGQRPGQAEIARLVLIAAAAAAQSERDEMGAFITHAVAMETLQRDARQPGAPVLSAVEVAGELWLQVHRFEEARAAFARAAAEVGTTPRIAAGLARANPR